MNMPDILFGIILLLFTINGFRRGLLKEIARLTGLFLGCLIGTKYHDKLIPFLEQYLMNEQIIQIISFFIIFLISVVTINFISLSIQKIFELIYLGWLNKLLGSLLGFLKGLIIISIIIFCMDILPRETLEKINEQSIIYQVGKSIQQIILLETSQYNSNDIIDLNKITKGLDSIEIPKLDSLIKSNSN